jgi:hypothetical protein
MLDQVVGGINPQPLPPRDPDPQGLVLNKLLRNGSQPCANCLPSIRPGIVFAVWQPRSILGGFR